jgi:hypothetical protein
LHPNTQRLLDIHPDGEHVRGVCVTKRVNVDGNTDFVSRYFAPWVGINEDPATGMQLDMSTHPPRTHCRFIALRACALLGACARPSHYARVSVVPTARREHDCALE